MTSSQFQSGSHRAREAGRKGGQVRAAQLRRLSGPYDGTILDAMEAAGLVGPSWAAWRTFLKAVFALPMDADELAIFSRHTERERAPEKPVDEAWMPVGRRGGQVSHRRARRALPRR